MAKAEDLLLLAPKGDDEGEKDEGGDEESDAGQDLIDAIKDDDPKAVYLAFERLVELCESKKEEKPEKE